ncbi:MAG: nitroreductase family protein [Saprospiraceae bacterium]
MAEHSAFVPYQALNFSESEMLRRASEFREFMEKRRSIRHFSEKEVPLELIENIIMTATSAPSGAHKQPWSFCVVKDPALKAKIRIAAEEEEYHNYNGRMGAEWLKDLAPFETDWHKPFLEVAPYLIIIFKKSYTVTNHGQQSKNYYVSESVGIAAGFLLAAIHNAGLVALTHTPSPMNFLQKLLERPDFERPFLLIPVGYPAEDTMVPDIRRKTKDEVLRFY